MRENTDQNSSEYVHFSGSVLPQAEVSFSSRGDSESYQASKMECLVEIVEAQMLFEYVFEQYGLCSNRENELFSNTYIFYLSTKSQHGHVSRRFLNFSDSKAFSYNYDAYNFNDSKVFPDKHVSPEKVCYFQKSIF